MAHRYQPLFTKPEIEALEEFLGAMTRNQLKALGLGDHYRVLADVHVKITDQIEKGKTKP